MSRQFYLTNSAGDTFDLMQSTAFFHAPQGLGLNRAQSFLRAGADYILTEDYLAQKVVSGEIVFRNYAKYTEFATFITKRPLTLVYKPESKEYCMNCYVSRLDKSEIEYQTNRLICAVNFTGTTKWYYQRSAISATPGTDDAKKYNYEYPYQYADTSIAYITDTNNSAEDAPCRLYIRGPVENPAWNLIVDGSVIQSGKVTATISNGSQLVVNSEDSELEIAEYTTSDVYVQNLYSSANYALDNFLYIPSGAFTLMISDDSGNEIDAELEIIEQYDTV